MPKFDSRAVGIHYVAEGSGPEVVLVHGFASSLDGNWRATGVLDALVAAGRRVIALDCRGHGKSDKPHDPAAYEGATMADDVVALMDHLGVERADLAGYSMGGFIAATLLTQRPDRFRRVVLAGVGDALLAPDRMRERSAAIARVMEADDGGAGGNASARAFRVFAERGGNDLEALAAMQCSMRLRADPRELGETKLPVLVLIGEGDTLAGPARQLAAAIPGAQLVMVPGDHLTAAGTAAFRRAVVEFLSA